MPTTKDSVACALGPGKYFVGDVVCAVLESTQALDTGDVGVHETDDGLFYAFDHCGPSCIYYDNEGAQYTSFSGFIGIIPWEMCKYSYSPAALSGMTDHMPIDGRVIDAYGHVIFTARNMVFKIIMKCGKDLVIDTRPRDDDNYDDDFAQIFARKQVDSEEEDVDFD